MKISELGERKVLELLKQFIDANELHIDDDAVAYKMGNKYIIINIDTIIGRMDILPGTTPYQIGMKTVTMTTSDIVAKGGKPIFFLTSIGVNRNTQISFLQEIERGIKETCEKYNMKFFGGDLNESDDLVISGVTVGVTDKIISRKGASQNETVWVTGPFGYSGAAFHYLLNEGDATPKLKEIIRKTIEKELTVKDGTIIKNIATSSMDSSDGLAITLNTLSEINNIRIDIDYLPIPDCVKEYAKENGLNPEELALYAGEEFEVVFTSNKPDDEIIQRFKENNLPVPIKIGKTKEGKGVYYKGVKVEARGWEHFKSK